MTTAVGNIARQKRSGSACYYYCYIHCTHGSYAIKNKKKNFKMKIIIQYIRQVCFPLCTFKSYTVIFILCNHKSVGYIDSSESSILCVYNCKLCAVTVTRSINCRETCSCSRPK